jgi:D-threo-aldose 1-dehydrogenase
MTSGRLPELGVHLTPLGFGSAPIGNLYTAVDDETAAATVDAAWSAGIRYFDTAPHYGLGLAERRLGAALADRPRSEFTISTKVGRLLCPNPSPTGSDLSAGGFDVRDDLVRVRDYSGDGVTRSLESSLTRLGLDKVDIVLIHDPDDYVDQAINEAIPALRALQSQGMVSAIGVGMNSWQSLARFVAESDIDIVMVAGRWTLLDRSAAPLLSLCTQRNVAVVAAAPFNSGLSATQTPSAAAHFDYGPASGDVRARAHLYAQVCDRHGCVLPQAALQFPLTASAVSSVVAGIRTPHEARADAAWMNDRVPAHVWHALDAATAGVS